MSALDTSKLNLSLCRASSLITVLEGLSNDNFGDDRADAVIHALRRELDAAEDECAALSLPAEAAEAASRKPPRKRKAAQQ